MAMLEKLSSMALMTTTPLPGVNVSRLLLKRCFSPGVLQKGAKSSVCKKYQIADKTVNSIWEWGWEKLAATGVANVSSLTQVVVVLQNRHRLLRVPIDSWRRAWVSCAVKSLKSIVSSIDDEDSELACYR
jgi:hypothetical protein